MENIAMENNFEMSKPAPSRNTDKKTSRAMELQRLLEYKLKFNVVEELIQLYPDLKASDKATTLIKLMSFLYPQLKAVEVDTREGEQIKVNIIFPGQEPQPITVNTETLKEAIS